MKDFLVIMSHEISEKQKEDAYSSLKVNKITICPEYIKNIWQSIKPIDQLPIDDINNVISWIKKFSKKDDYILIQGEFGATYYVVSYCLQNSLIPVYATSKRSVIEEIDGDKVITHRIFEHVCFRRYISYENKY